MTNTINMPNYSEIYYILMRNHNIKFKAVIHFQAELDDHQAIVQYASKEFPEEYKEALAIASDPKREIATLWCDEVSWFVKEKEFIEWENEELGTLIYDFVTKYKLESKFHSFLMENKENYALDLDHMAQDYE